MPVGDAINESTASTRLPSADLNHLFSKRFLLRSAWQFGSEDAIGAFRDIAFVCQIDGRNQLFVIKFLTNVSIQTKASGSVITGLLSPEDISPGVIERV